MHGNLVCFFLPSSYKLLWESMIQSKVSVCAFTARTVGRDVLNFLFQLLYLSTLVIRLFIVQLFFSQLQSCFVHWASLMYNHLNKCTFPSTNETSFPPWQNVCLCGRHFSPLFVPFLSLAFIFCLDTRVALYLMKEYHANHFIFFQHPILVQSVYFQLFLS